MGGAPGAALPGAHGGPPLHGGGGAHHPHGGRHLGHHPQVIHYKLPAAWKRNEAFMTRLKWQHVAQFYILVTETPKPPNTLSLGDVRGVLGPHLHLLHLPGGISVTLVQAVPGNMWPVF